jgi:hypothetical protein
MRSLDSLRSLETTLRFIARFTGAAAVNPLRMTLDSSSVH